MLRYLLIILWLIYFILPYDLLPDFLPLLGRLDDLGLLAVLYWNFLRKKPGQGPGAGMGSSQRARNGSRPFEEQASAYGRQSSTGRAGKAEKARNPYDILNVDRYASTEEIRHAYRQLANRYHPDKVAHLGDEFQELAKLKFQDIQWAYETLMKSRVDPLR